MSQRLYDTDLTARERLSERRLALRYLPEPRRIAILYEGRVLTAWASQHRTRAARIYQQRLRLKVRLRHEP